MNVNGDPTPNRARHRSIWAKLRLNSPFIAAILSGVVAVLGAILTYLYQANEAKQRSLLQRIDLHQRQNFHSTDTRLRQIDLGLKWIPYLDSKNEDQRRIAIHTLRDLGLEPVSKSDTVVIHDTIRVTAQNPSDLPPQFVREGVEYGLWRDFDGRLAVGGSCGVGQQCAKVSIVVQR